MSTNGHANGHHNGLPDGFEWVRLPPTNRHKLPGYYALADLPQQVSIAQVARKTGWWEFDQIFRFYPRQFVVLTGIAGHGKSTFAFNLLHSAARLHGTRSFMFVPENEGTVRERLRKIHLASGGNDRSFADYAQDCFYVQSAVPQSWNAPPITLDWVLNQAAQVVEKDALDILLIDPWNELEQAKRRDQSSTEYIGESLMLLKAFARAACVTVILIAHPTKAVYGEKGNARMPGLADIEGSMHWYNKCDNGLIVWRDFASNTAKVVSAKVREIGAGKLGTCHFQVEDQTGLFTPQYGATDATAEDTFGL